MAEGREGDWECRGCSNLNYAFRSFCNRCKLHRLLVDSTPSSHSKWLPRFGDWICSGCTNNNYASREICNKCGQPKEVAGMPAVAVPEVFARTQGAIQQSMGLGMMGNFSFQQPLTPSSNWSMEAAAIWPLGGSNGPIVPHMKIGNQLSVVPKGWRNGDWICNCGFHNYSSRNQCKRCDAVPPGLGMKRLASDELVHDWDNKRLNTGPETAQYTQTGLYPPYPNRSMALAPMGQVPLHLPQATAPTLIGKGAKQWRDGDWMCPNCNNHNYASRLQCNRSVDALTEKQDENCNSIQNDLATLCSSSLPGSICFERKHFMS